MSKRQTKRQFLFPAVAITSISVTGGIAYWWLTHQQQLLQETVIGGKVIPRNAFFTVSVSTDLAKWDRLQTYGTPETKAILNSQLASFKKRFLTDNGYDYQRDIQPWIGKEVLIGYLPLKSPNNPKAGQFVAVLPIADKLKAQQLLSNKPPASERTYKGIKINLQDGFSTTLLGDDIIAATSPEAVEIAVDTFVDKSGIGSDRAFLSALAEAKNPDKFGSLYLNIPTLTDLAIARAPQKFPQDSLVKAQREDGIFASITLEPERIRFQGVSWVKPHTSPLLPVENRVTYIPSLLPSDTLMLVSGSSAKYLWENISFWSNLSPFAPIEAKELEKGLESLTGLSWEGDLLPWMKEEFALSLVPKAGTDNATVGLILMAKASDRAAADRAFAKLDNFVAQKYQLKVSQAQLADLQITRWLSQTDNFAALRGFLEGNMAFVNLGDDVGSQILPRPQNTPSDNPLYRLATDGNLTAANARFFLDLERTVHPGNLSLPRVIQHQDEFLKSIKAIGLTTSASEEQTYKFELSIVTNKL